jgi:hypothetical protein
MSPQTQDDKATVHSMASLSRDMGRHRRNRRVPQEPSASTRPRFFDARALQSAGRGKRTSELGPGRVLFFLSWISKSAQAVLRTESHDDRKISNYITRPGHIILAIPSRYRRSPIFMDCVVAELAAWSTSVQRLTKPRHLSKGRQRMRGKSD